MTTFALALVLLSAFTHASWNLLAKRAQGGAAFGWLIFTLAVPLYAPLVAGLIVLRAPRLGPEELLFILGSALLHVAYFLLLFAGYRAGDLSLVYPLARGTGPLLSTIAAIVLLGERPTPLALAGAAAIVGGAFLLTGDPRRLRAQGAGRAVGYALLTGVVIAAYTIWDKYAVGTLLIAPLLYDWTVNLGRVALLTPSALRDRAAVAREWRAHRREAIGVAMLSPLSEDDLFRVTVFLR